VIQADRPVLGIDTVHRPFGPVSSRLGRRRRLLAVLAGLRCAAMARMPETADRCFQVAFRIDQEVGGNDDLFAGLDAIHHFDMVLATPTQLHVPRLEAPFAVRDEDDLAGAAVDDSRIRHGHDLSLASYRHLYLGKHRGLQELARIGQFDPNRHRPRFGIEGRINIGHAALEDLVRVGIDAHLRHGPRTHLTDVLFEHVGDNPHRRQVGHLIQGLARHEAHPL
jgi:hypothetical protein